MNRLLFIAIVCIALNSNSSEHHRSKKVTSRWQPTLSQMIRSGELQQITSYLDRGHRPTQTEVTLALDMCAYCKFKNYPKHKEIHQCVEHAHRLPKNGILPKKYGGVI